MTLSPQNNEAQSVLADATKRLRENEIDSARLDTLLLLEDITKKDRSWLLAHPEYSLTNDQLETLNTQLSQREQHVPLAYIRGHVEFYGQTFAVSKNVLIPRPESESMLHLLTKVAQSGVVTSVADIGTGSGALAICAAKLLPDTHVYAVDVDAQCLSMAKINAQQHSVTITFLRGNLLEPLTTAVPDVLLCNLPYVPNDYPINRAATHEPKKALYSGQDGLDHYRELFAQIGDQSPVVITESLASQHSQLAALAKHHGYIMQSSDGLAQLFTR